jgi:hypothetical protein
MDPVERQGALELVCRNCKASEPAGVCTSSLAIDKIYLSCFRFFFFWSSIANFQLENYCIFTRQVTVLEEYVICTTFSAFLILQGKENSMEGFGMDSAVSMRFS